LSESGFTVTERSRSTRLEDEQDFLIFTSCVFFNPVNPKILEILIQTKGKMCAILNPDTKTSFLQKNIFRLTAVG
jgi:hypothetical protein